MIEGSAFSGLLTRVEIGYIRIGSAGNGRIKSPGSGSSLSSGYSQGHAVVYLDDQLVGVRRNAAPGARGAPILSNSSEAEPFMAIG
jgi:hypothetical protein